MESPGISSNPPESQGIHWNLSDSGGFPESQESTRMLGILQNLQESVFNFLLIFPLHKDILKDKPFSPSSLHNSPHNLFALLPSNSLIKLSIFNEYSSARIVWKHD
jgi:hypothetical protein